MYSSNNIIANNSIGVGSLTSTSDGFLTITKRGTLNSNLIKFGYDDKYNFVIGDNTSFGTWKKQFYINNNAADNSLLINSSSFVGIGNTDPLGQLHIGNTYITNDGNLIISKRLGTGVTRNFKFGYDNNFNFIMGDFGDASTQTWKPQFYINSNAPQNSFTIDGLGNVGIGTTSTQKLAVNGNTNIIGSFTQSGAGTSNIFTGIVGIGTTNPEFHNLNVNGTVKLNNYLYSQNISNLGVIVQKGKVRIGSGVTESSGDLDAFNVYINSSVGIDGNLTIKSSMTHSGGDLTLNSTRITANSPTTITSNLAILSKVGIGTTNPINVLQIGNEGGKLRISNDLSDYTVIGTNDTINSSTNTRILIKGSSYGTGNDQGNIEFYGTTSGKFIFYSGGSSTNEIMRISSNGNVGIGTTNDGTYKLDVNGTAIIRGNFVSTGDIKESNLSLKDIYIKQTNLSNLSVGNFNLKKKFGYNSTIGTTSFLFNNTSYYKYDIYLSDITRYLSKSLSDNSATVRYRIFNIKCFSSDGVFENPRGNINGNMNILNYDVFMSDLPITPTGVDTSFATNEIKNSINITATGTPENLSLTNILPGLISLIRTTSFDYLSIVSKYSNLNVSYIIEDYLG